MATRSGGAAMELSASNIGGIEDASVTLEPGVNVLEGRNASNRTSLLQAIMAALGSERASLKGDADEGSVELALDGETYFRRLVRRNGDVVLEGDPYLEDPEIADLFAFLLESNEARRAVERGGDLRELIMRPIDTRALRGRIDDLEAEKRDVDAERRRLEELDEERRELATRRSELDAEIERREAELADVEADLDERAPALGDGEAGAEAVERLRRARTALEELEYDLETERETLAELEAERRAVRAELADVEDSEGPDDVAARLEELRERKRSLDDAVAELQRVIGFNEERLADGGLDLATADATDEGAVTDELLEGGAEITCWTCGSTVERDRIEATLERLRELHQERLAERREVTSRIDDLADRQAAIRERERRRDELAERRAELDAEIESVEARIDRLEEDIEDQRAEVTELEAEAAAEETDDRHEAFLERHREASQIELEIERRRDEREAIEERLAEIDAELATREDLAARREEIDDELRELRTRIDRLEADAVEAFNEHMAAILGVLEYENVERIWIERAASEGTEASFDLHVVRTTDGDEAYEDTVEHLSESEREVTGLVFALAGYLVHEVHETVPFVLLDSLEAIDAERIARLVDYFAEYAECLVVALLPEDAAALPDSYTYHTEI